MLYNTEINNRRPGLIMLTIKNITIKNAILVCRIVHHLHISSTATKPRGYFIQSE